MLYEVRFPRKHTHSSRAWKSRGERLGNRSCHHCFAIFAMAIILLITRPLLYQSQFSFGNDKIVFSKRLYLNLDANRIIVGNMPISTSFSPQVMQFYGIHWTASCIVKATAFCSIDAFPWDSGNTISDTFLGYGIKLLSAWKLIKEETAIYKFHCE